MVLWFHIICCSAIISAIFMYSISIQVLFFALFLYFANIIDLVPYKWYQSTFLGIKQWVIFFQGRDVFRCPKTTGIYLSMHKSVIKEAQMQEIQVVLKCVLLAILVTPVGTPSSGSASDNTCIQIDLDLLSPPQINRSVA